MWVKELQDEHREWLRERYVGQDPILPLAGLIGEAGECQHACLSDYKEKMHGKNPRHVDHRKEAVDAIGDCVLYALSWFNTVGEEAETLNWNGQGRIYERPLDLGYLLVSQACCCYEYEIVTQRFVDVLIAMCYAWDCTLEEAARGAWAEVKGRIR